MPQRADEHVDVYLERLRRSLADLPRARRKEIVDEIREHIAEARAERDPESEAAVLEILDHLGEPDEIAAEARERLGRSVRALTGTELTTLALLLVGGFLFVVGWIVGVVMLWNSVVWTWREKLFATLVVPGGLAPLAYFAGGLLLPSVENCGGGSGAVTTCTGGPSEAAQWLALVALVFFLVGPFVTTWLLAHRARRRPAASAGSDMLQPVR